MMVAVDPHSRELIRLQYLPIASIRISSIFQVNKASAGRPGVGRLAPSLEPLTLSRYEAKLIIGLI